MFLSKKKIIQEKKDEVHLRTRIIQALKEGPLEYSELVKKTGIDDKQKSHLSYYLDKLQGKKNEIKIIEKIQKHPPTYKLVKSGQTHEFIVQALIQDDCRPKTLDEIKKIIGKKASPKDIEESLVLAMENRTIVVPELDWIPVQYHNVKELLTPSAKFYIPYWMYETFLENKICIRCKKKIKPNELKLFRSNTEFHKKILDEEYNRTEYPKAEYSLYCFHIQCISKTTIEPDKQKDECSHCFLPLSRGQLIEKLNINWNDKTLVSNIDKLFGDSPINIIWSSYRQKIAKERIEDLGMITALHTYGFEEEGAWTKIEPNIFTCEEIEGKKYHPYCATLVKKKY